MPTPLKMNGALAQLLTDFRGREIVVLLNRGNRGDGVIHLGARQFFDQIGITYREFHETDDLGHMNGDVLLIHGAGAMSRGTHTLPRLLKVVAPRFQDVVMLPSSFDLKEPRVQIGRPRMDDCPRILTFVRTPPMGRIGIRRSFWILFRGLKRFTPTVVTARSRRR